MGAAAAAIGVALLFGLWLARTADRRAAGAPRAAVAADSSAHRSIAVLGFRNLSGRADADWLSTALAEMLTTELIAGDSVRAIAGENVARMKVELKLIDTDTYAPDTLGRIRSNLGADLIMLGSYVVIGDAGHRSLRLDVRVQDTRAGGRVASISDSGGEDNLPDLVSRIGSRLRTDLSIDTLSTAQSASVRAALPSSTEAIRQYAQGLDQYRASHTVAAIAASAGGRRRSVERGRALRLAPHGPRLATTRARPRGGRRAAGSPGRCPANSGCRSRRAPARSPAIRRARSTATANCGACFRTISTTGWPVDLTQIAGA